MKRARLWTWGVAFVCLAAVVWVTTSPYDRFLQMKQAQLWVHGYHRHEARAPFGTFGYYMGGDENAPVKLLFIHGLSIYAEYWTPVMKTLTDECAVCSIELLGFGRSLDEAVPAEAYTISLYSQQVGYVLDTLGWKKPVLVGVSLGGWVSARYALDHPDRVAGLLLIAPGGLGTSLSEDKLESLRDVFDFRTPDDYRKLVNESLFVKPRDIPELFARMVIDRASKGGHRHFLSNLKLEDWIGSRIAGLSVPLALVWGTKDRVFPYEHGRELVRTLPNSRLFTIEGAGHSYLFEEQEQSVNAIREALDWLHKEIPNPTGGHE